MPNPKILKDTVYLYHYLGEKNYEAEYAKFVVKNCALQHHFGVGRRDAETTPESNARLYIFDGDSTVLDSNGKAVTFIEPDKYKALGDTEKAKHWTVSDDEKDYFGETDGEGAPTGGIPNYYKVVGYTRFDTGSKRIHHTELFGK